MVRLAIAASTGGLLVGSTTTEKLWLALSDGKPLSLTTTLKALVPTCAAVGVHLNTPLAGLMVALVGAPDPRLKVSTCGGLSGSVARLVITRCVPTAIVWLAIAASTGGLLGVVCKIITVTPCLRSAVTSAAKFVVANCWDNVRVVSGLPTRTSVVKLV